MQDVIKDLTGVLDLLNVSVSPQNSGVQRPLVIFFDAVGTVFGVRDGVGVQYANCADRVGVTVSAAALESAFYDAFKAAGPSVFPLASADLIHNANAIERFKHHRSPPLKLKLWNQVCTR